MPLRSARGHSLVELLVALVILEIVGAAALAVAFTVERLNRHATSASATDAARWREYRTAESRDSCVNAATPDTLALLFPESADRPRLETLIRCGR
ncbi:MAG: prepilin-type N-terminal cleavage/methylation domain-containing protein [Gemmatimonadota bacterium]